MYESVYVIGKSDSAGKAGKSNITSDERYWVSIIGNIDDVKEDE